MAKKNKIEYLLKEEDWETLETMKKTILDECEVCDHTGHRLAKDRDTKTIWTKTIECRCLKKFRRFKEYYKAKLPETYWRLDEKNFKGDKSALKIIMRYCENLDSAIAHGLGVLMWGTNGNGKTTMSGIIAKHALKKGYTVYYLTLQSMLNMIMASFGSDNETEKIRNLIMGVDILIVDEIGKEHIKKNESTGTVFGLSEFEQLLRSREGNKKILIGVTNLRPQQLDTKYGESIASLFKGMLKAIEVSGADMRRTVKSTSWEDKLMGGKS